MGADDPNKPDYTKFLKKRGRGERTNVVPLLHDCYKNLIEHIEEEQRRSATRIQTLFRGRLARDATDREAERMMLFKAEDQAKAKALVRV
jgi:hypothetical protein